VEREDCGMGGGIYVVAGTVAEQCATKQLARLQLRPGSLLAPSAD
jgi:hypothetical protein